MRASRSLVVAFVWGMALVAPSARADDAATKAECASTYEKSQELRASGKLTKARELLVVCAQAACPAFVQADCAEWLADVEREQPTIVISARDTEGADTVAVRVLLDGQPLLSELDGKGTPIDPGAHRLRFELEGALPIEQSIVIRQAEKDRPVRVSWEPPAEIPPDSPYAPSQKPPEHDEATAPPSGPGPLRPYAFVAGGVGAAGIIGFAVLGTLGNGEKRDLEARGCKPNCPQSDVDAIKTKYVLADVSLGVGIAGLATGVALFLLSRPESPPRPNEAPAVTFDVRTSKERAFATVSGRF